MDTASHTHIATVSPYLFVYNDYGIFGEYALYPTVIHFSCLQRFPPVDNPPIDDTLLATWCIQAFPPPFP